MKYIQYWWTVTKHRWYVFLEACKLGIPFLGFIHDWSKYLPAEFFPYAEYFNGGYERGKQPEPVKLAFDFAWLHHQRWNKHHWQSYVLHNDQSDSPQWVVQAYQPEVGPWNISVYPKGHMHNTPMKGQAIHIATFSDDDVFKMDLGLFKANQIGKNGKYKYWPHDMSLQYAEHMAREMSRLPKALPMPDRYRREMLADWRGAGRAYGNSDTAAWYLKNKNNIILHPETRQWIEDQLNIPLRSRYHEWAVEC